MVYQEQEGECNGQHFAYNASPIGISTLANYLGNIPLKIWSNILSPPSLSKRSPPFLQVSWDIFGFLDMWILTPHTLQLKISPSYESDRETMENATLRQLFSHGLSLPNGLPFNNLNSILNFSKDHSHNFFARPSEDLLACSKHSLEAWLPNWQ